MIGHGLEGCRQEAGMALKEPASAGFLLSARWKLATKGA